jgi:hypothetical protein
MERMQNMRLEAFLEERDIKMYPLKRGGSKVQQSDEVIRILSIVYSSENVLRKDITGGKGEERSIIAHPSDQVDAASKVLDSARHSYFEGPGR